MDLTITVTNPQVLANPWVIQRKLERLPDLEVGEAFCAQNSRNATVGGHDIIDLTPPK